MRTHRNSNTEILEQKTSRLPPEWEMAVHLAVAGNVLMVE